MHSRKTDRAYASVTLTLDRGTTAIMPNEKRPLLEIKNLSFSYPADDGGHPVRVMSDLSLTVGEGEFVAVLGHNGSGKSTLAKLMSMILAPDSGDIVVDGQSIYADGDPDERINDARREIGMVFQNPDNQLVATIVEEDVAFGCENLGVPSDEIRRRVDESLAAVGMSNYARSTVYSLSGGQKQRVAIAGVLAMHRRLIIFDESTAMLDPSGRREVMAAVEHLNRVDGVTVVFITHYMSEAARADRVVVMSDGGIIMDDVTASVFTRVEELRAAGLDVPQTTELLYMLRGAGYDVSLDALAPEACAQEILRLREKIVSGK